LEYFLNIKDLFQILKIEWKKIKNIFAFTHQLG